MASLVGNPQDIISTPYGYSGQMAPETAIAEQALNRRRLLANMLTQQGMQPQQGRMVGRFFVGPSPVQGGAGLAQVLAGGLGNRAIDSKQKALMDDDRTMVIKAIQDWKAKQQQSAAVAQAPANAAPSQAAAAPVPAEQAPPTAPLPLPEGSPDMGPPLQNIGPRPQQPAPNMVVPSDPKAFLNQPPVDYRDPAAQRVSKGTDPSGIDMAHAAPGDMSTMIGTDDPAKAQAQLGDQGPPVQPPAQVAPAPTAPPMAPPQMAAAPRKTTMDDLAELLTHQHPQVRAYGAMLAQQMQREQERADQRNFMKEEKDANRAFLASQNDQNRAVQREGLASRLDNMMMLGLITKDQKDAALAQQDAQNKATNELRDRELRAKTESDKRHDETLKAIAGMKANPATRPMSSTAQKELIQTEEELQGSHQAIQNLQSALKINNDAMGFTGAGAVASAGSLLPEALRPKAVDATVDLDNLITGSALPQLKAIFGGMPTEGERKVLLELQGSSSKTPAQRQAIFERAIQAANNRIKFNTQKAQQLRSGQYFAGDGGLDTTVEPNPGMPGAASTPAAAPAMKNAKGWTLHTDAKGNKAYVSPDGKQFEEVR